jgi:hypothetical protein
VPEDSSARALPAAISTATDADAEQRTNRQRRPETIP